MNRNVHVMTGQQERMNLRTTKSQTAFRELFLLVSPNRVSGF